MMANTESMIKQLIMAKSTKPSPNESTTPTLKARGARCAPLDPGPLWSALLASVIWIWLSNPRIHLKLWNVRQILLIRLMVGQRGALGGDLFMIKSFYFPNTV